MHFRPSSAPIWGNCSGSVVALNEALDRYHPRTVEGTAAHKVGETLLNALKSFGMMPPAESFHGKTCPETGLIIDDEMIEGANIYAADVQRIVAERGGELLVECPIECPQIDANNNGTLDAALVNLNAGFIVLWDYKHGHAEVSPLSLQFVNYAAGLINKYGIDGHAEQHITIELRVVQPFCYQNDGPVQSWRGKLSDLRGYTNQLAAKAYEAHNNPTLTSGAHCYHCPALWRCPAVKNHVYKLLDHAKNPPEMDEMNGEALAIELSLLETAERLAKARRSAIEDLIIERVKGGDASIPLRLESKPGRLKWDDPKTAIKLGRMLGADFDKCEPITPTQAIGKFPDLEEVIRKKATKSASLKLVKSNETIGAKAFGKTEK